MGRLKLELLAGWGGLSFLAGVAIETCFAALIPLSTLRGPEVADFLAYFVIASLGWPISSPWRGWVTTGYRSALSGPLQSSFG